MAQSAMGLGQQCGGAGSRAEDPAGASSSGLSFLRCAADAYARRPGAAVVRGSEDAAPGVAVMGKVRTGGAGRYGGGVSRTAFPTRRRARSLATGQAVHVYQSTIQSVLADACGAANDLTQDSLAGIFQPWHGASNTRTSSATGGTNSK
jgi:hypothetical protein